MNKPPKDEFEAQSQSLREQMTQQRQRIARRLDPNVETPQGFPRSMTLRFLIQRPAMAAQLLASVATLLVGARFVKTMASALIMARAVRSAAGNGWSRSATRPAERNLSVH